MQYVISEYDFLCVGWGEGSIKYVYRISRSFI